LVSADEDGKFWSIWHHPSFLNANLKRVAQRLARSREMQAKQLAMEV